MCAVQALREGRADEARRHQQALWPQLAFELELEGGDAEPWPGETSLRAPTSARRRVPDDGYAAIEGAMSLALVDTNPLALVEAHPDEAVARGFTIAAAAQAVAEGEDERAMELLVREHEREPGDLAAALFLADRRRRAGDAKAAAQVLSGCAVA